MVYGQMTDKDDTGSEYEKFISREALICFVVIRRKNRICIEPLKYDWQGMSSAGSELELNYDDEILAVIPAPEKSYEIKGLVEHDDSISDCQVWGEWVSLGYEFKGATYPDWKKLLTSERTKIKNSKHMDE
ncbi:hypothetical protein Mzhil_1543 [Methanosalsum zhilinae DSM 4017]|uniref:Uncharacterized protein n=2 Tax=Methanosalsum zhilinae TaxID=39669 RepID=F7XP86_METZD|nr:hypothetical protein Mzhil_1543 [Methanosalsum zhilinae DSM 4017]